MPGKFNLSLLLVASAALLTTGALAQSDRRHSLSGQAPPPATAVTCKGLKTTEVVNSTDQSSTNSTDYVYVPGAAVHFVTKKTGCVLVTFSAVSQPFANIIFVQMLISGGACLPSGLDGPTTFAGTSDGSAEAYANSMTYICRDVAGGRHGVMAQWKTRFSGPTVGLYGFTMTVAHR